MEKNYETFVNNLRERLLKATGYQEEMICYKTAEEYPPTDGDRLLLKNRQREGVYEVCALYVADLYEWHQNGATMERIVQEIMHGWMLLSDQNVLKRAKTWKIIPYNRGHCSGSLCPNGRIGWMQHQCKD